MGNYAQYSTFDPGSGQLIGGGTAPDVAVKGGQRYVDWAPGSVVSEDPHAEPFDVGDEPPSFGPIPENIVRSFDAVGFDGDIGVGDDGDAGIDDLDGDGIAQDGDFTDDADESACDDCGDIPENIVVRGAVSVDAARQAGGLVPGPLSRSRR